MKTKLQVRNLIVVLVLLLLSIINIRSLFLPKKVLGVRSEELGINNRDFWKQYIKSNPKYLPAYLELGEIEKVRKLDPNWLVFQ